MSLGNNHPANLDELLGAAPQPFWRRHLRWIALGLGLLVAALLFGRITAGVEQESYQTEALKRGDLAVNVTATGNLAPTNQVDVGSEISGIVARVLVDVNDKVVAGQPLAVIDTSRLADSVTRSKATLAANDATVVRERATLAEAQAQLARLTEVFRLSGGQVPSQAELAAQRASVARAQAALHAAQANVVAARAQLSSDTTQMSKAVIRSPVSGVVLKRTIDPGQTVQAAFNTPSLFIIAEDLSQMKLEVSVDEADVGQVKLGQRASFTVDAWPGRRFPAKVERINLGAENLSGSSSTTSAAANSNVVSYLASLTLSNDALILRPGMTATATIETAVARAVLLVPNAALRFTPPEADQRPDKSGFKFSPPNASSGTKVVRERGIGIGSRQLIYVLSEDGSLRGIAVTTGFSDGRNTEVTGSGLQPGMRVVTGVKAKPES